LLSYTCNLPVAQTIGVAFSRVSRASACLCPCRCSSASSPPWASQTSGRS
jgi:hypothetical protein